MSLYYNSAGQLVQSGQIIPPYPHEPQAMYANQQSMPVYPGQRTQPNQQAMSVYPGQTTYRGMPGETQTGLAPYNHRNDYPPDQHGPRRSPRLHTRPEPTPPYSKKKSTTRKVVEGVVIGVAGTVILSEIEKRNRKTPRSGSNTGTGGGGGNVNSNNGVDSNGGGNNNGSPSGNGSGLGLNEVVECGLAAGAVALALYEKNRKRQGPPGSEQPHNASLGDPRMKTLVEGALATAAAVALAYHENGKQSNGNENGHTL
jgi:hypothetical protein